MNCHGELEEYSVGNVEPVKFITQAAIELPSISDDTRGSVKYTL